MNVSVIIPTYNGAHKILNTLLALEQQTIREFEVVVVIDGSTDNTYELLNKTPFKLNDLKVTCQENRGRAAVRNRGAREAKGDLLIFFDDDMRPIPECVEKHICHHKNHPKTILCGNPIEDCKRQRTDFQRYKASLSQSWVQPLKHYRSPLHKHNMFLAAANFSLPKNLFDDLAGFDERLNDIEDLDFALRALERKVPIYFNYEAIAWHDDFVTCASYVQRQVQYHKGLKIASNISVYCKEHLQPRYTKVPVWKKALFSIVCQNFVVNLIDKTRVLEFLMPKRVRYRFYSILVWGFARNFSHRFKA